MNPRRLIASTRRWFPLLIVSVLLAAGAAYVFSSLQARAYEAKATLIVGQSLSAVNPDYNQLLVSQRLSTTYATVATKRPILDSVIKQLGLSDTAEELSRRVRADAQSDSALLDITVQDANPSRAAVIANAVAEQLIAASPAIQGRQADLQESIDAGLDATQVQIDTIQAQVQALTDLPQRTVEQEADLQTLDGRLVSLRATFATLLSFSSGNSSNLLTVIEPAFAQATPVSPRPILNVLVAALFGLLLAIGVAFLAEYLDDAVKDSATVEKIANLRTLGTIAKVEGAKGRSQMYMLASLLYPRSAAAEGYRTLRTNVEFAAFDPPARTLLVTSPGMGEGKTVTASNLAIAFAQAGRRVLLIDADLRKPGVHVIFDLPNAHGLTTLLQSDDVSLDVVANPTEQPNLRIITTGPLPPNPTELLGSERMRNVVERLKSGADLVIFDSSPMQVTDASVLGSFLDGTLLVIDAAQTRRGEVVRAREALAMAGATVLGAVLNRAPKRGADETSPYYGNYYGSDEADKRAAGISTP